MAPTVYSAKLTLSCPLFAADFDPRDNGRLIVGGGGGEGRSGVGNKISLIDTSNSDEITEAVEINLSRDEDSVTSLAAAPQPNDDEHSLIVLAGINSSVADQKKGVNQHMRSFRFDVPRKKQKETTVSGTAESLSRASIFRSKGPDSGDTYQRVMRLSPWRQDDARSKGQDTRVGAIATGMAQSGEVVFFKVGNGPTEADVIGRIRLEGSEEAEDVDFASLEDDMEQTADARGKYRVAYTNGVDVMVCEISASTRSDAAPEVRRIHTIPLPSSGARAARPKFRALRFLTPTVLILLQNAPNRGGSELVIMRLPTTDSGKAKILRRRKLARGVQIGLGLDICPLGTNPSGQQQTIIAVSGSDNSISLLTLEYNPSKGYSKLQPYSILRDVHPFSMTKVVFSKFISPTHPVTADVLPQSVKLASISMGNTVVVHTLPLSPLPPSSRTPRYVLSQPGATELRDTMLYIIALIFSLSLVTSLALTFAEIRGVTPPILGAQKWVPEPWRHTLVNEYTPPAPGQGSFLDSLLAPSTGDKPHSAPVIPSTPIPDKETQIERLKEILDRVHNVGAAPIDLATLAPKDLSVTLRCGMGENADQTVLVDTLPAYQSTSNDEGDPQTGTASQEQGSEQYRSWTDLSPEDQRAWKQRLTKAGRWTADEGETVLKGVLFGTACGYLRQAVEQGLP
ncbi:Uncharacterized protein PECH_000086 [Penicillium ucsense]|uniref:Guanine nucleotide-exchange factor SEC12 n=1 Tax=Penicillium ucsense TaxID=2839758 RepID=A0A8J8W9G1_9EURO|nr:Uncharacterized protein PECM_003717 [Penicillium ucsense]KAF7739568.1 Uncharacterized protein PECH_000086 [Penicillium ucsense]